MKVLSCKRLISQIIRSILYGLLCNQVPIVSLLTSQIQEENQSRTACVSVKKDECGWTSTAAGKVLFQYGQKRSYFHWRQRIISAFVNERLAWLFQNKRPN